jgi:hypothetical protein
LSGNNQANGKKKKVKKSEKKRLKRWAVKIKNSPGTFNGKSF